MEKVMNIIERILIFSLVCQCGRCRKDPFNFPESVCPSLTSIDNSSTIEVSCEDSAIAKSVYEQLNISIISNEAEIFCRSSTYGRRRMSGNTGIYHIKSHNTLDSIVDLMIYWRRKIAAFLYDDYSGFHSYQLSQYLRNRFVRARLFSLNNTTDLDAVVLNSTMYQNIVIICHPNLLDEIIKKAKVYDLLSKNFTWTIVNGETPEAIYGVDIPPNSQVTLISPKPFVPIINEAQYNLLAVERIDAWSNISISYLCQKQIKPSIAKVEIRLKPQDKMATHLMASPTVNMYDIFFSPTTGRTETVKFADWKPNRKYRLLNIEIFHPKDKLRLRGRRVRMVAFQHTPYTNLRRTNGSLSHVDGYAVDMMYALLDTYNLRHTKLREIPDIFGIGINGTYTGMVRLFYDRETDLAMNVLAMTNSRAPAVRYAGPVDKGSLAIVYARQEPIIPPTTYLMPFSTPVWIVIIVGIIVILFATFLTLSISPASNDIERSTQSQRTHNWLYRLATMMYLDEVMDYPLGGAAKILHGTLLLSTLAVFIHYTSTFKAYLTYQEDYIPFKSIEDVVERKDYDILMLKNGRQQDMLQYAPPGPYRDVWNRVMKQGERSFSRSFETAYEDFCKVSHKLVLLTDGPTTMHLSSGNCSVAFAPVKYMQEYYNAPHRCDFPFSRIFTIGLYKILESGILNRLIIHYDLQDRPPCHLDNAGNSFGISQVMGVFVLHACGILLSLLALIVERQLPKRLSHMALKNKNK